MLQLLTLEINPPTHSLLRLLYAGTLRISELYALTWRDLQPREDAGQVTVFGKGGKTRVVLLTPGIWTELTALRGNAGESDRSGKRGHLTPVEVHRLVKQAAVRAGVSVAASAHWLRHPMPARPSTAALRCRSCRPPLATPRSPRPAAICTPGQRTAQRGTCRSEELLVGGMR